MAVTESNRVDWNTARGKLVWAGMIAAMVLSACLAVMGLYALITGTVVVFPESWGAVAAGLALAGSVIVAGAIFPSREVEGRKKGLSLRFVRMRFQVLQILCQ